MARLNQLLPSTTGTATRVEPIYPVDKPRHRRNLALPGPEETGDVPTL